MLLVLCLSILFFSGISARETKAAESSDTGASTGKWVMKDGSYFWLKSDGTILREGGWHILDGKQYFLANNSGRRKSGWQTFRGRRYYLDPSTGVMVTGFRRISGKVYYFEKSKGSRGQMRTGTVVVNGERYFFNSDGSRFKGWKTIKGRKYFYGGKNDAAVKGWYKAGGTIRYFDPKTGAMHTGWLSLGKDRYYFLSNGRIKTGYLLYKGKKYYFQANGKMVRGWKTSGKHKYYFGTDGARASGFTVINQKTFYFDPEWGYMVTGYRTISGKKYFFRTNGVLASGIQNINGKLVYIQQDGTIARNRRVIKVDGAYYEAKESGELVKYTGVWQKAIDRLNQIGWDLRTAYNWCAREFVGLDDTVPEGREPCEYFASWGFEHEKGDCYVMAAMLYYMAYVLGEDAHFVMGYVPLGRNGELGPHGWLEIDKKGVTYYCDPDLEAENRMKGVTQNGFMFTYGTKGTYRYTNGKRMN